MFTDFDRFAMTRALELAQRGLETADPNPRVGCVIAKSDRILAEGWHARAGEAHAEAAALRDTTEAVAGATAYVTLEPCSHHGRTAPCTDALIAARVARVVFAIEDPNPRVSGNGAAALRHAGIAVESGLMAAESTELNVGFLKRMRLGLPWVRVKLAMSLDGRTALADGASQWITGEESRHDVQLWRARSSAILTGIGTLLADDPHLNVRLPERTRQPLRVVLDSQLRAPPGARIFSTDGEVVLFTEDSMQPERATTASLLESQGAKVEIVPSQDAGSDGGAHAARGTRDQRAAGRGRSDTRRTVSHPWAGRRAAAVYRTEIARAAGQGAG
jgi:diaminohydroxyphosphoribosylaminopyrimidine deaminase / 5-amino-6-(5-phosphoribosylamino)uracil reductase